MNFRNKKKDGAKIIVSTILVVVIIFIPYLSNCQIRIATRIGLISVNGVQLDLSKSIKENTYLFSNFGYIYQGFNLGGDLCGVTLPDPLLNKRSKGVSFSIGITRSRDRFSSTPGTEVRKIYNTFSIGYRRFWGIVEETSCSGFSRYDFVSDGIGFLWYRDYELSKKLSFYHCVGTYGRIIRKEAILMYSYPRGARTRGVGMVVDIGFKFSFDLKGRDQRKIQIKK